MWDDEQHLRAALHRVVEVSAPPPATRVEEVIRRGRRVLITRIGTVASAILAVVGIGIGAAALGNLGLGADGERLPPAGPALSSTPLPEVPKPGWAVYQPKYLISSKDQGGAPAGRVCKIAEPPVANGRSVFPEDVYLPVFVDSIKKNYPADPARVTSTNWINANRGLAEVVVNAGKSQRTISLTAGRYGGQMDYAAEFYAVEDGVDCNTTMHRMTLPNGAILQATAAGIWAYTPAGRRYRVSGYEMDNSSSRTPESRAKANIQALPESVVVDILTRLAMLD